MTKRTIDLNADLGEASDQEGIDRERALLGVITSANIACGGHAGDAASMAATVAAAMEHSVGIGAHPSYPDRQGFGRRPVNLGRDELRRSLVEQLQSLGEVCRAAGVRIESVKPHGALYEEAGKGGAVYEVLRDAVRDTCGEPTPLVLPSGCRALAMVMRDGLTALEEGFCDRAYRGDGGLVPRGEPGAVFTDPEDAARQALSLARGAVVTSDGAILTLWVDTLCVHGDTTGSLEMAVLVRRTLAEAHIDAVAPKRA